MVRKSQTGEGIGAHLVIHGRVQGVGYRFFTQDLAETLGLVGWVRNCPDGTVESYVEGPRSVLEAFIKRLEEGLSMARVESINADWQPPRGGHTSFSIRA
jgi:acylphosphatase